MLNCKSFTTNKNTAGDKIKNTVVGTGLGVAVGGATLILVGTGASLVVGSAYTTIGFLGATSAQTVAVGALAYNILAMLLAPFFGARNRAIRVVKLIEVSLK